MTGNLSNVAEPRQHFKDFDDLPAELAKDSSTNVAESLHDSTKLNDPPVGTVSDSSTNGAHLPQDVEDLNGLSDGMPSERYEPNIPTWRLVSLYVSICFGLLLSFVDTSIVATALYTIGDEFHSLGKVNWVALAYELAYLGCTALFASLSDVIGRRNAYIAAGVMFLAFSLGCGFAQTMNQLIAFRALQGVGGSGLYSIAFVILPQISSLKMLKMIGALAGAVIAMAGVLGPVLGGIITNYTTWRWIFWINAPIGIGPLLLFIIAWPTDPNQLKPAEQRPFRQIDAVGFVLLVGASIPFVFAFQQAGIHLAADAHIWRAALFIAPLIVGVVCWVAFLGWEWLISCKWEDTISALFPMRLAKDRVYTSAVVATMLTGFPFFVVIYSLPIYFQVVHQRSALGAGLALLPMLGSSAIGSMLAGMISGKKNNTFQVMMVAAVLMLIGTATLTQLNTQSQARAYGFQVFVGLGFGLTVSTTGLLAGLQSEIRDSAVAQGLMAQGRMLGGSFGIAASTVVLANKQRRSLLESGVLTPQELQSLHDSARTISPERWQLVREAYTDAFNDTMLASAIIAGVCVLVSAGIWQKNPPSMEERRRLQGMNEAARQRLIAEKKAENAASASAASLTQEKV